jgi:transposase
MTIVAPTPAPHTPHARFAAAPWHDQHPDRCALEALLEPDHLARLIEAAVARLDLSDLHAAYAGTGSDAHPPALLLRAVLFETERGHHSPATWWRDARECGPLRWLLRGCTPARSCWYAFKERLLPRHRALNAQPLTQAIDQGLTPATRAAVDGTLVAANASRHHLLNEAKLDARLEQLSAARAADEKGQTPADVPGWMAKQPHSRQRQHKRFRKARAALSTRQARNLRKRPSKQTKRTQVVVSAADCEAAVGLDKEKVFRPLYNVQLADDLDSPFILNYETFAQPNDAGLLPPLLGSTPAMLGHALEVVVADTSYAGGADLKAARAAHVTVYAPLPKEGGGKVKQLPKSQFTWLAAEQTYQCPQGHRLVLEAEGKAKRSGPEHVVVKRYRCPPAHCVACPLAAACAQKPESGRTVSRSEHEEEIEALRARMDSAEAKTLYKLRRQTVELVNADWKEHRKLRRFSGRGLERVRCQVGLIVLVHNLLTLLKEEAKAKAAAAAAANPAQIAT